MDEQEEVLTDVAKAFADLRIPWLVTGGFSVSFHGSAETTLDLDLKIGFAAIERDAFLDVFSKRIMIAPNLLDWALEKHQEFNLIHQATSIKVDLWPRRDDPSKY